MTTHSIDLTDLEDKEAIRRAVWRYMEMERLCVPADETPVIDCIPNFVHADIACNRLLDLPAFHSATRIKINPDKAQRRARYLALKHRKILFVPTPRLATGLFNQITPKSLDDDEELWRCSDKAAIETDSVPIGIRDVSRLEPDLIIVGSVAVDKQGHRIGKGAGYADIEFAILNNLGGYDPVRCTIISIVHDCQVFDQLNPALFEATDFPIDLILTPTQTIVCQKDEDALKKRTQIGLDWSRLGADQLEQMPILKELKGDGGGR